MRSFVSYGTEILDWCVYSEVLAISKLLVFRCFCLERRLYASGSPHAYDTQLYTHFDEKLMCWVITWHGYRMHVVKEKLSCALGLDKYSLGSCHWS